VGGAVEDVCAVKVMAAVIELSLVGDEVMLQLLNLLLSFPDLAVQVMVAFDVT